jgi:hypothetical protein
LGAEVSRGPGDGNRRPNRKGCRREAGLSKQKDYTCSIDFVVSKAGSETVLAMQFDDIPEGETVSVLIPGSYSGDIILIILTC